MSLQKCLTKAAELGDDTQALIAKRDSLVMNGMNESVADRTVVKEYVERKHKELHASLNKVRKQAGVAAAEYKAPDIKVATPEKTEPTITRIGTTDGLTTLGFVEGDTVYLNPYEVRVDTPFHEIGGHMLAAWARANHPQLWQKILSVARTAPEEIKNEVRANYSFVDESNENFLEEVFAHAVGWDERNQARTLAASHPTFLKKLREIWDDFINYLFDHNLLPTVAKRYVTIGFDAKEFETMSLSDFTNMVGEKLFSGRRLAAPKDLINYRAAGADFSLLREDDFIYDPYGNIVGVRPEVHEAIMVEKTLIKQHHINQGTYMRAPDGSPTKLTEDQWLTTQTVRFQEWAKERSAKPIFDAIASANIQGPLGETLKAWSADPGRRGQVLQFLNDQVTVGGAFDQLGEEVIDQFNRWLDAESKVLQTENGEPDIFELAHNDQPIFVRESENGRDVKSANNNTTFSSESNDVHFQRIGENSNLTLFQRENLAKAKEKENDLDENQLFQATGWFRGIDGKWRYELPNADVYFTMPAKEVAVKTLGELLDYPALYEAYPQLRDMRVNIAPEEVLGKNIHAGYSSDNREIFLSIVETNPQAMYLSLRHEVQHAIQHIEGFETGSNFQIANTYFLRKINYNKNLAQKFRDQLNRIQRQAVQEEMQLGQVSAITKDHIRYLISRIATLSSEVEQMESDPEYWRTRFYYRYAGENEAFGVERRAKITDRARAKNVPDMLDKTIAIMWGDNQKLKPLFPGQENKQFTEQGEYKGDPIVQAMEGMRAKFSQIPADPDASFNRGLGMWKNVLELTMEHVKRGGDKRILLTSPSFLNVFGAKSYQQLPDDVRAITETIWKMNGTQQELVLQAVTKALNSKAADKKAVFKRELGKVREQIAEAQKLREPKDPSITVERPEVGVNRSSLLRDIANGMTDEEIIDERRAEMGRLDQDAENRLRRAIEKERRDYEEFEAEVNTEIKKMQGNGRLVKEFHKRLLKDGRFVATPAFKKLSNEVRTYAITSKEDATTRARDLVDSGIENALAQLHIEAAENSAFVPVLAGALLEKLKSRKNAEEQQKVLEIMYDYTHQAGLNLSMVGAFYHMLGMADAAGKINFFIRVKNRMMKNFYARMRNADINSEAFREVRDIQADVFESLAKKSTDDTFTKRIEKLIRNLKDC